MKKCSDCKLIKDILEFYKNKAARDGLCNRCKLCTKIYSQSANAKNTRKRRDIRNRDKLNKRQSEYTKENRSKMNEYYRRYYGNNKKALREKINAYYNSPERKPYNNARSAKRRARLAYASFKQFANEINDIYKNCPEGYHVDHIMPLNGKTSCGLHVPWNLQYLPAQDNLKKGNKV